MEAIRAPAAFVRGPTVEVHRALAMLQSFLKVAAVPPTP
jgi:hypothetical protein